MVIKNDNRRMLHVCIFIKILSFTVKASYKNTKFFGFCDNLQGDFRHLLIFKNPLEQGSGCPGMLTKTGILPAGLVTNLLSNTPSLFLRNFVKNPMIRCGRVSRGASEQGMPISPFSLKVTVSFIECLR